MSVIQNYLISNLDEYKPQLSNAPLQQVDNYQIYDLHCVDVVFSRNTDGIISTVTDTKLSFLAVQAYDPEFIHLDFAQIILDYP
jgi:hypothetical protein